MSQLEVADNNVAADTQRASSAYVPPLQRTEGQPPPIAANGGLSYMSFDRDGDAGTAAALEDALAEIAEGEGQRVIDMIDNAPPGPIKTKWGLGFRDYDECVDYIRSRTASRPRQAAWRCRCPIPSTSGRPTPSSRPTRSGGTRRAPTWRRSCARTSRTTGGGTSISRRCCATRGASASTTRASRPTAPNAWTGSASRWRTSSPSARTSTTRRRWSACSTRRSRSSCSSSSRTRPMRWSTTTTSSTRTTRATARKTRTTRTRA